MREAIYVDKVGEEAPLKEEIIIASLKEGTKEPKDIKSLEKAEGVVYKEAHITASKVLTDVFSRPIDLHPRVPLPSPQGTTDLNLSDIYTYKRIKMLESYYEKQVYLEAFPKRTHQYIEELEELVKELPYEDFVSLTYRSLERYGKTPIDLTYDLLNEMARELYKHATNEHPAEPVSFTLNFENKEILGEQLKKLRTSLKIGMRELSRHSSISQGYISQIEAYKYDPTIISLSEYLLGLKRAYLKKNKSNR